ncbi:MAG: hypothetical protein AAFZ99_20510 [Pseudomonadota bacterium]
MVVSRNPESGLAALSMQSGESQTGAFFELLELFADCVEEVNACQFRREGRRKSFAESLLKMRDTLLRAVHKGSSELDIWLDAASSEVRNMAAAMSEAMDVQTYDLDRPAFIAHTSELIEDVKKWDIDQFAKKSLLLSLDVVRKQSEAESISTTDVEIRRRIKMVVASFAIEFAEMDKEFESRWETLKRWARFGYGGASVPLGLTADASAVAGLLPKP